MTIKEQKEIFKKFLSTKEGIVNYGEKYLKKHYNDLYNDFLKWTFPIDFKITQKLYHYVNDDKDLKLGLCKVCGNRCYFLSFREGYRTYCSNKCCGSDPDFKSKKEQIYLKKYNVKNPSQLEEVKTKKKNTCLNNYGVENPSQSDTIKDKKKTTCLNRYGVDSYTKSEGYKKLFNKEFVKHQQEQSNKTKKKNHTFNTSKLEDNVASWLRENNFNFERQYRSEEYPFNCDFYLNDYNLYIEIQGSWTHGNHPFDKDNEDDINIIKLWDIKKFEHPYYSYALNVWTIKDVHKRQIAKKNKLNFLETGWNNSIECITKDIQNYILQN